MTPKIFSIGNEISSDIIHNKKIVDLYDYSIGLSRDEFEELLEHIDSLFINFMINPECFPFADYDERLKIVLDCNKQLKEIRTSLPDDTLFKSRLRENRLNKLGIQCQ